MKYTMHDQAPREHRGIIMLPQYEGWSATWFDFSTSEQHPASVGTEYTQGEPWRRRPDRIWYFPAATFDPHLQRWDND